MSLKRVTSTFRMALEVIIVILLVLYILTNWRVLYLRSKLPPGPFPLPLIGNILSFDATRPQKMCQKYSKKYGPIFTFWAGTKPVVVITDHELMKEAFVRHGDQLTGRPRAFIFDYFLKGNYGLFFSTGEIWKEQRRFSVQVLRNFGFGRNIMEERIIAETQKLIESLQTEMRPNGYLLQDIQMPIQFSVGSIMASILFGRAFEKGDPKCEKLQDSLNDNFQLVTNVKTIMVLNSFPWARYIPLFGHFGADDLTAHRDTIVEFMQGEIDRHHRELEANPRDGEEPLDFIEAYLREMKRREQQGEDFSSFSDWQLVWVLGDLMLAGMEATVSTVRWAILAMMLHPEIQQKVHQEIDSVLGKDMAPSLFDRQNMPYVMATLSEVQRWGNVNTVNVPHTDDQDVTLGGYNIPKGTYVICQISALAIDEDVYPEPEKFQPERFLMPDGKTLKKVEHLAPFSLGKRNCLGEVMARTEFFLMFVHLMQHFTFSLAPGGQMPSLVPIMRATASPQAHECLVMPRSPNEKGHFFDRKS